MQLLPSPPLLRFFALRWGKTLVTNARIISKYSFSVPGERTLTQVSSEELEKLEGWRDKAIRAVYVYV